MARMGGEDAYNTDYKKDVKEQQDKFEDEMTTSDGIKSGEEEQGNSLLRKFSF